MRENLTSSTRIKKDRCGIECLRVNTVLYAPPSRGLPNVGVIYSTQLAAKHALIGMPVGVWGPTTVCNSKLALFEASRIRARLSSPKQLGQLHNIKNGCLRTSSLKPTIPRNPEQRLGFHTQIHATDNFSWGQGHEGHVGHAQCVQCQSPNPGSSPAEPTK